MSPWVKTAFYGMNTINCKKVTLTKRMDMDHYTVVADLQLVKIQGRVKSGITPSSFISAS